MPITAQSDIFQNACFVHQVVKISKLLKINLKYWKEKWESLTFWSWMNEMFGMKNWLHDYWNSDQINNLSVDSWQILS